MKVVKVKMLKFTFPVSEIIKLEEKRKYSELLLQKFYELF